MGQGAAKMANKISLEHKIKLKKRLAKAYKRSGLDQEQEKDLDTPRSPYPHILEAVNQVLTTQPTPKILTATHVVKQQRHQDHKPDPLKSARHQQLSYKQRLAQEEAQKEAEIQERISKGKIAKAARKETRKKMNARTKKGQPVLSNQIDQLLSKIQKNMSS